MSPVSLSDGCDGLGLSEELEPAWRIQCLILAKACLIGLRSGEYGGRNPSFAPAALMACRMAADLWLPRLSMITDVAVPQDLNKLLTDIGAEAFAIDGTVEDARSGEFVAAQGAQEGHGAPMSMRGNAGAAAAPSGPGCPSSVRACGRCRLDPAQRATIVF